MPPPGPVHILPLGGARDKIRAGLVAEPLRSGEPVRRFRLVPGRLQEHESLNIVFASSEVVPFAKTGGLADVVEALPRTGKTRAPSHRVRAAYRHVHQCGMPIEPTDIQVSVTLGSKVVTGRLLRSHLRDSQVPVYLVEQDAYFDRPQLYRDNGSDYKDNCERFAFFCLALMQSLVHWASRWMCCTATIGKPA